MSIIFVSLTLRRISLSALSAVTSYTKSRLEVTGITPQGEEKKDVLHLSPQQLHFLHEGICQVLEILPSNVEWDMCTPQFFLLSKLFAKRSFEHVKRGLLIGLIYDPQVHPTVFSFFVTNNYYVIVFLYPRFGNFLAKWAVTYIDVYGQMNRREW
jgi:hypothetical protein